MELVKAHLNNSMEIIRNHSIMKNRIDKKLLKEYWRLKELKAQPQVKSCILKIC